LRAIYKPLMQHWPLHAYAREFIWERRGYRTLRAHKTDSTQPKSIIAANDHAQLS
jgi:hypothetical protein